MPRRGNIRMNKKCRIFKIVLKSTKNKLYLHIGVTNPARARGKIFMETGSGAARPALAG